MWKTKHILRLTSQRVSEVFMFRLRDFHPRMRRNVQGTHLTNVTLSTACNMSQNRRFKVNMRLSNFYFCFPSGFLQEKEKQKSWQLTTRDVHISLLREQHGFRDRPFHPSSQQTWSLNLTNSDLGSITMLCFFLSLVYLSNKTLTQWDLKLLIFFVEQYEQK